VAVVEAVVEALIAAYSTNRYCKQIQQLASCLGCDNTYRIGASEVIAGPDSAVGELPDRREHGYAVRATPTLSSKRDSAVNGWASPGQLS
jgi:hypothetical protein